MKVVRYQHLLKPPELWTDYDRLMFHEYLSWPAYYVPVFEEEDDD